MDAAAAANIFGHSPGLPALRARVRRFVDEQLIPHESAALAHGLDRLDALAGSLRAKAPGAGVQAPPMPAGPGGGAPAPRRCAGGGGGGGGGAGGERPGGRVSTPRNCRQRLAGWPCPGATARWCWRNWAAASWAPSPPTAQRRTSPT